MKNNKLLPRWFTIWFIVSCIILFIGGVADHLAGKEQINFNAWAGAIGIFIMYLLVLFVWRFKGVFSSIIASIHLPPIILSVLVGLFFAEIDELVNFPFNPLVSGISLGQDILLTIPMYIFAHFFWFLVLRKYKFTPGQALITGGVSIGIFEAVMGGASPFGIVVFPFIVMIHGVHMVMPAIFLSKYLEGIKRKETKWKYFWGILLPVIGTLIGIGVALIIASGKI